MRVKLRSRMAGPSGVIMPNEERELPDDVAESLIAGGYAVLVAEPAPTPEPEPQESATVEPEETAMLAEPPRRRRKG